MSVSKSNKKLLAPTPSRTSDPNHNKNASVPRISRVGSRFTTFASNQTYGVRKPFGAGASSMDRTSLWRPPVQILDDVGMDVTPLPLLQIDPNLVRKNQTSVLADNSVGTPTDLMSQASASIYGATQAGTSVFGGGPFTRSVFTQSYDTASDSLPLDEMGPAEITTFAEVRHKRQEVHEKPMEEDLAKVVDIMLTETDMIWMLDMPDVAVSVDSAEAKKVIDGIKAYTELQKSRVGNDLYAERGMNTFNEPLKLKNVYTQRIEMEEADAECTNWDMYDTYKAFEIDEKGGKESQSEGDEEDIEETASEMADEEAAEGDEEDGTISRPISPKVAAGGSEQILDPSASYGVRKERSNSGVKREPSISGVKRESSTTGIKRDTSHSAVSSQRRDSKGTASSGTGVGTEIQSTLDSAIELSEKERLKQEWDDLCKSEILFKNLFVLERIVSLNSHQQQQAQYRGLSTAMSSEEPKSRRTSKKASAILRDINPKLDRLWSYSCPLTQGRNVSCISWNRVNLDLVAVGYGQFEFTNQKPGLVCCWCIKNPKYPERIFTSKQGVTALDFSLANPNLLAVGYYDGGVAVYNIRKSTDEPVLDNFSSPGKHTGPVWQLKWVEKERGSGEEKAEVLISISTDGRICQWSIRKGLESYDVMKLKKMPTRMAGKTREKKGEALISRYAGGLCFDFHFTDLNIYLAGTEEGYIHKCSCSHNEQFLESYLGHTGPVYAIEWSPFVPDVFLSCSADWTSKLWHQDKVRPVLSFHSSTRAVHDICWSPWVSTVFACVNEGAVEIWNLASSTLDAVYSLSAMTGVRQTTVSFSKNSQCLLVGDSEGQVTVYELQNIAPLQPENQEKALKDVLKASLATQLPGTTEDNSSPIEDEEEMESTSKPSRTLTDVE